jgi:hypothetical protein
MGDYQIVCVKQDEREVITHVGIQGKIYTVKQVVEWINTNSHTFYTLEKGVRAKVYAKKHPVSGNWFLQSSSDGVKFNNLDYLTYCDATYTLA